MIAFSQTRFLLLNQLHIIERTVSPTSAGN